MLKYIRSWRTNLVLVFGSTFFALFLAEVAVRVAVMYSPQIAFYVSSYKHRRPQSRSGLEEFLLNFPSVIVPHQSLNNYYTNAFGFSDVEFESTKKQDLIRIITLGDSFTFGLVPYSNGIMTVTEQSLQRKCGEKRQFEIYNMGIPGSDVNDYRELFDIVRTRFSPDVVLVNFYMGNDGPDLLSVDSNHSAIRFGINRSYLYRYLNALWKVYTGVETNPHPNTPQVSNNATGGERVDPTLTITDDSPIMKNPTFAREDYIKMMQAEVSRMLRAQNENRAWKPILEDLKTIITVAKQNDIVPILSLLPSQLQVDARKSKQLLEKFRSIPEFGDKIKGRFDPELPRRTVTQFAHENDVALIDVTDNLRQELAQTGGSQYVPRNTHWNIRGNRIAGEQLGEKLAQLLCPNEAR